MGSFLKVSQRSTENGRLFHYFSDGVVEEVKTFHVYQHEEVKEEGESGTRRDQVNVV